LRSGALGHARTDGPEASRPLAVHPNRKVGPTPNLDRAQPVPQRLAFGDPDHILVEGLGRSRMAHGNHQRRTYETHVTTIRDGFALGHCRLQAS
jgi:hypothetical protein